MDKQTARRIELKYNVVVDIETGMFKVGGSIDDLYGWSPVTQEMIDKVNNDQKVSGEAKKIIGELIMSGYSDAEIASAMCDGEYLKAQNISQELSEQIYNYCS